jgi:hypothetical protein
MLEYTFFLRKTRLQLGDASDGEAGGVDARLPGDATGESVGNGLDSEGFLMAMLSVMRRASSCEARNSPLRRRSIAAVTCSETQQNHVRLFICRYDKQTASAGLESEPYKLLRT